MNPERRTTTPPSTADTVTTAMGSTGASIFSGASSPIVNGGEVSNSQRDQNRATVIINVGGSNLDSSRATLVASETSSPSSVKNTQSYEEQSSTLEESSVFADSGFGSDTSLEIVVPPAEEQKPAEETVSIGHVIYKHHMLLKGHGIPLYIPQPGRIHSVSYQRQGVRIGDVGVFTPFGGFDRFFNICLPAGDAMNPVVLPEGFCPLGLTPADVCEVYAHGSDSYLTSPSVPRTGTTFRCSEPEGAILTMPQGAYHEELRNNIKRFRDYINLHLPSWYDYANIVHGQEVDNGKIHLVIGCDKTTSWGIATYSHRQSKRVEDNVTNLSFNVNNEGLYPKYGWDVDGIAEDLKAGPEEVELLDPPERHAVRPLRNQCTFIRALDPALGDDEWKKHQLRVAAAAEVQAPAQPTRKNPLASVLGAVGSLLGRLGSLCGYGNSKAPAQTLVADHPATPILNMLRQKCPNAKVVIVNDRDWCSVIRDSDKDWITTAQDLPRRIQEAFDILEDENGTAYLQEKKKSSQHLNTSSHIPIESEDEDLLSPGDRKPKSVLQNAEPPEADPLRSEWLDLVHPRHSERHRLPKWNRNNEQLTQHPNTSPNVPIKKDDLVLAPVPLQLFDPFETSSSGVRAEFSPQPFKKVADVPVPPMQLFDPFRTSPSDVKADFSPQISKNLLDDGDGHAKPDLFDNSGEDLEVISDPLDIKPFTLEPPPFPGPTSEIHKQKEAIRDFTMFDDASSKPGTPSFRESFAQTDNNDFFAAENADHYDAESFPHLLPVPTSMWNILDDTLPRSSEPAGFLDLLDSDYWITSHPYHTPEVAPPAVLDVPLNGSDFSPSLPPKLLVSSKTMIKASQRRRIKSGGFFDPFCNQDLTTSHDLKRRLDDHYKANPCPHCSIAFATRSSLHRHLKSCKALETKAPTETAQQLSQDNLMTETLRQPLSDSSAEASSVPFIVLSNGSSALPTSDKEPATSAPNVDA